MTRITAAVLILLMISVQLHGQGVFGNPLLIPPSLSGTFAEIRSNHFHSGVDLRTNESEGLPVLAAADGFVSRIKVSATGFGNVVYLKHPEGFTSVYAHLHHFNDTLERLVESEQFRKKSFEVEFFPAEGSLPVNQGQLIGFSGNTGSSAGPHLHFEIRETRTEKPFDPLSKLSKFSDTIPPVIRNIMLIDYVHHNETYYPVSRKMLPVSDPEVSPAGTDDTLHFASIAGIAVQTDDRMNGSNASLGIKNIILKVNGKITFHYEVETFAFSESKYVNACIDYAQLTEQGKTFILLHQLPGNDFSGLNAKNDSGFVYGDLNMNIECEVSVSDFNGNSVSRIFFVRKTRQETLPVLPGINKYIAFNKIPVAQNTNAKLIFPAGKITYNIHDFEFETSDSSLAEYSVFVKAGSASIPLHQACELFIKTRNLPASLHSKSVIVRLTDKNERLSMGGVFLDGWVKASVKTLGNFFVTVDTIAPQIKVSGVSEDVIWQKNKIEFKLYDDLSGIDKYEITVDDKWVPARYDAKTGQLVYVIPSGEKISAKSVTVKAIDQKGNKSVYTGTFSF